MTIEEAVAAWAFEWITESGQAPHEPGRDEL